MIQASSNKRPTYIDTGSSKYLDFDGSDDTLSVLLDLGTTDKITVIVGWKTNDSGSVRVPIDYGYGLSAVNGTWCFYTRPFSRDELHFRVRNNNNDGIQVLLNADNLNFHVDSTVLDLSLPDNQKLLARRDVNNSFVYSASGSLGTSNLVTPKTLKICDNAGTGFSSAKISGLLIINRVLNSSERLLAESWIAQYAGITL